MVKGSLRIYQRFVARDKTQVSGAAYGRRTFERTKSIKPKILQFLNCGIDVFTMKKKFAISKENNKRTKLVIVIL